MSVMKYYEKIFTPDEAIDIVENRNDNFRKLKVDKAMEYARVMISGKWCENNGEPITFYTDGNLANGQHRLYGLYKSGMSLKFLVVEGIPKEATETIDTGIKRSAEDVIRYKLRGTDKELVTGAFSVAKQVMVLRKNCKANDLSPYKMGLTEADTRDECLNNIDSYNEAALFGSKVNKESKVIKKNEAGSIYYYLVHDIGINSYYVKDYFNKLSSAARNDNTIFNTTVTKLSEKGLPSTVRFDQLMWGWNSYIRGCVKKRCQFSGWFEYPKEKYFYEKEIESSDITEDYAESPILREIS